MKGPNPLDNSRSAGDFSRYARSQRSAQKITAQEDQTSTSEKRLKAIYITTKDEHIAQDKTFAFYQDKRHDFDDDMRLSLAMAENDTLWIISELFEPHRLIMTGNAWFKDQVGVVLRSYRTGGRGTGKKLISYSIQVSLLHALDMLAASLNHNKSGIVNEALYTFLRLTSDDVLEKAGYYETYEYKRRVPFEYDAEDYLDKPKYVSFDSHITENYAIETKRSSYYLERPLLQALNLESARIQHNKPSIVNEALYHYIKHRDPQILEIAKFHDDFQYEHPPGG